MKITTKLIRQSIKEELLRILLEGYEPDEFATAAGMQQDLDDREKRGSFEKGDWGIEGSSWGEMKSRGEFPWIQDALSSLSAESHPERLKAVEALANELGVSVSFRPFEPLEEGEKDYPNNSTMKKLVGQAKRSKKDVGRNPNYDPKDDAQLKKDYDKHVRDTRRDPKYNPKGK